MRISVERDDPGYQPPEVTTQYEITFNGELQTHVLTADSDAGYMRSYVIHDGSVGIVGDEFETRDYFGTVRIEKRA